MIYLPNSKQQNPQSVYIYLTVIYNHERINYVSLWKVPETTDTLLELVFERERALASPTSANGHGARQFGPCPSFGPSPYETVYFGG